MDEIKQLNIKDAEAYDLAREIADIDRVSLTGAVVKALRAEVRRARRERDRPERIAKLLAYGDLYTPYPRSTQSDDEILGYDEIGVPT